MPLPIHHPHPVEWYTSVFHWIVSLSTDKWLKFVQISAFVLGSIGAYYKFFRGRIYNGRLESSVSATAVWEGDNVRIKVTASIKDIGLTKLDIDQNGTALRLSYCEPRSNLVEASSANWKRIGTFRVFENDHLIESGETVQDQQLILVPKIDVDSFQIELSVFAGRSLWRSRAIVTPEAKTKASQKRIVL